MLEQLRQLGDARRGVRDPREGGITHASQLMTQPNSTKKNSSGLLTVNPNVAVGSVRPKATAKPKKVKKSTTVTPDVECTVCLESYFEPVSTRCGHTFCFHCIVSSDIADCPLCRATLRPDPDAPLSDCFAIDTAADIRLKIHLHPRDLELLKLERQRRTGTTIAAEVFLADDALFEREKERLNQRVVGELPEAQKMSSSGGFMRRAAPSLLAPSQVQEHRRARLMSAKRRVQAVGQSAASPRFSSHAHLNGLVVLSHGASPRHEHHGMPSHPSGLPLSGRRAPPSRESTGSIPEDDGDDFLESRYAMKRQADILVSLANKKQQQQRPKRKEEEVKKSDDDSFSPKRRGAPKPSLSLPNVADATSSRLSDRRRNKGTSRSFTYGSFKEESKMPFVSTTTTRGSLRRSGCLGTRRGSAGASMDVSTGAATLLRHTGRKNRNRANLLGRLANDD